MDKDVMKRLLRDAGIPTARFVTVDTRTRGAWPYARIARTLGKTIFVKPANLGSSVGISKAASEREYAAALRLAFRYDTKVLVEECVHGREIECSVLGNERPAASLPGEIVPRHEFYSYEAKYIDDEGARLLVPAALPARSVRRIQDVAVRTFVALGCEGLGRVDLFLRPNGQVVVNEINTIPGFTRISMYPKMWEVSGLSCGALVDRLIALAVARHARDERLRTSYR
jgi:D-alanine-D-alanine ligase